MYGNALGSSMSGMTQSVSTLSMPTPATGRRTLTQALDEQAQALAQLHMCVDELEARIRPILDAPNQPPNGVEGKVLDPSGPLDVAERHTMAVQGAIARLHELTRRIHL